MGKGRNPMYPSTWGSRADGSPKERGFLGVLKRPDGNISTEISVGVDWGEGEIEIPTLVPGLNKKQIDHLLSGEDPTPDIIDAAIAHAKKRIAAGRSPFWNAVQDEAK